MYMYVYIYVYLCHPVGMQERKGLVDISIYHVRLDLEDIERDTLILVYAIMSLAITRTETRRLNHFDWFPVVEVGIVFFAIFLTMIPVVAILDAGLIYVYICVYVCVCIY